MKRRILLSAIIILTAFLVSTAQVKQISSKDFWDASSNAYKLAGEMPRRIVTKTDIMKSDGTIYASFINTEERIFPNKTRTLRIEKEGNNETILEKIQIGTKLYSRENNGQWKISEIANASGFGSGAAVNANCLQYTETLDFVDGVSAKRLNNLEISKNEKGLSFESYSVWYAPEGFFLRSERIGGLLEPRIEESRSVTTYEYDPKDLKIDAPVK